MKVQMKECGYPVDATRIFLPGCQPQKGAIEIEVPIYISNGEVLVEETWKRKNLAKGLTWIDFMVPLGKDIHTKHGIVNTKVVTTFEAAKYISVISPEGLIKVSGMDGTPYKPFEIKLVNDVEDDGFFYYGSDGWSTGIPNEGTWWRKISVKEWKTFFTEAEEWEAFKEA